MDTMLGTTNITNATPSGSSTFSTSPAVLNADNVYIMPWIATARPGLINGNLAPSFASATRTSSTCFMRGLKETITVQTNSGAPWMWRRVCFTYRGGNLVSLNGNNFTWWRATDTQGVVRNLTNIYAYPAALNELKNRMYEGTEQFDWVDLFNAKLDRTQIDVKYDKTITFGSGNSQGILRNLKRWHPMNKNLVYADEEDANILTTSPYTVDSNQGMGDYYVVDLIRGVGTGSDLLSFSSNAQLYWHEK